jgi:hypothetical protein
MLLFRKNFLYLLITVLSLFIFLSCNTTWDPFEDENNGSIDDGIEIPIDNTSGNNVNLTENNADNAVLSAYDVFTMQVSANDLLIGALENIGFLTSVNYQKIGYSNSPITEITPSTKNLLNSVRNRFQGLSNSDTINCYDDGNYRYTINPGTIKFIFRECKDSGYYLDGEVKFRYSGSISNPSYSQIEIDKTFNLSYRSSNITYYTDYTLKHTPTTSRDKIELNGTISANINRAQFNYKFDNFLVEERTDSSALRYDISGNFYTNYCNITGWLKISTDTSIKYNIVDNCPSNGDIKITGSNAAVRVSINFDDSIDMYIDNNKLANFVDCYDATNALSCSD